MAGEGFLESLGAAGRHTATAQAEPERHFKVALAPGLFAHPAIEKVPAGPSTGAFSLFWFFRGPRNEG
jgi:hypothetical protein